MQWKWQSLERYRQAERALWAYHRAEPHERFLNLATPHVRVRVQEVGQGEPVLFIHGGPNAGSTWASLAARLQDFRCIVLDRPGCGLSDSVAVRDVEALGPTMVDTLVSVLDALGIARAHVVASSFGGWCGMQLAHERPDRVRRMVQFGCPAFAPNMQKPPFMRMLQIPGMSWLMSRIMRKPNPEGGKSFFKQMGHEAALAENRIPDVFWNWSAALFAYTDTFRNETRMIRHALPWRGDNPILTLTPAFLAGISTPTAFFWGAADTFGGEPVARTVVDAMPHATLEMVEAGGHLPWLDNPPRAAEYTRAFLNAA